MRDGDGFPDGVFEFFLRMYDMIPNPRDAVAIDLLASVAQVGPKK